MVIYWAACTEANKIQELQEGNCVVVSSVVLPGSTSKSDPATVKLYYTRKSCGSCYKRGCRSQLYPP